MVTHSNVPLTNQHLNDHFSSPFSLVSVAIRRAREMAANHQEFPTSGGVLNPAYQILQQIYREQCEKESRCEKPSTNK